jgi:hypothetical protein
VRKALDMSSRNAFCALCLVAAFAAVACGTEDDSAPSPGTAGRGNAGSSGKGNAGSSGTGNAGSSGKPGGNDAGADNAGGSAGTDDGTAGEGGQPPVLGCTHLSAFVHAVIKDDTNAKSAPRPVNGVVFCDDPADPAAYNDLF